jgi:succinate dehydrogenase (ubiquinone) flavoprotein subunit
MMRAFARAVSRRRFNAHQQFLNSRQQHRKFASVNGSNIKNLTVIDHHYE